MTLETAPFSGFLGLILTMALLARFDAGQQNV
jgi:hypothetical protein